MSLAVGDVGTKPAILDRDELARIGVRADLLERAPHCLTASPLRLREYAQRLVQRDGQQLLLVLDGTGIGAPLDVWTELAVLSRDLLAV